MGEKGFYETSASPSGSAGTVVVPKRTSWSKAHVSELLGQGDSVLLKHAPFVAVGGSPESGPWHVASKTKGVRIYVTAGWPEACEALAKTLARLLNEQASEGAVQ